jgi:hypothetical protein
MKQQLPTTRDSQTRPGVPWLARVLVTALLLVPTLVFSSRDLLAVLDDIADVSASYLSGDAPVCPQPEPLTPEKHDVLLASLSTAWASDEFVGYAVDKLAGAVRVRTETFDDMGPVGEDERWENRAAFHEYLESAFPLV